MFFQTLEELQSSIGRDHPNRVKFATKLFHILTFTKSHPGTIPFLGASWCQDNLHFICNSTIIANFLGLKSNSVNTNFRDHGFEIVRISLPDLTREFPCLTTNHNWKKRINHQFIFTANSTLADIERIPCREIPGNIILKREPPLPLQIPPDILDFIRTNAEVSTRLFHLWEQIDNGVELIQRAFEDWRQFGGEECITSLSKFASELTKPLTVINEVNRIVANVRILLSNSEFDDPNSEYLDFTGYFAFTLRYGFLDECLETLMQLTNLNGVGPPYFYGWFQPLLGRVEARLVLGCQPRNAWLVRTSEENLGSFVLMYKRVEEGKIIIMKTDIVFDPLSRERRLAVEMQDEMVVAGDWTSMLYSVLKLNSKEAVEFGEFESEGFVNGSEIARLSMLTESDEGRSIEEVPVGLLPLSRRPIGQRGGGS
jgi:hypothetical protein